MREEELEQVAHALAVGDDDDRLGRRRQRLGRARQRRVRVGRVAHVRLERSEDVGHVAHRASQRVDGRADGAYSASGRSVGELRDELTHGEHAGDDAGNEEQSHRRRVWVGASGEVGQRLGSRERRHLRLPIARDATAGDLLPLVDEALLARRQRQLEELLGQPLGHRP